MSRKSTEPKRQLMLRRMMICGFSVAALSQARVNLVQRGDIIEKASKTDRFTISRTDFAKRGGIFSSDGKPLAQDEDTRILTVEFAKVPHSPGFFMDLAAATGIPASEFQQLATTGVRSREWRQPMSASQARAVQEVKTSWRSDGVSLTRSGLRHYPLGDAASGFIGAWREGKPFLGLELSLNDQLGGTNGKISGLVDRQGAWLPMRLDPQTVARKDGDSVTLTIDSEMQFAAQAAVKQAVESNKAEQGMAIVADPATGDILAMANWPTFDPNAIVQGQNPSVRHSEVNGNYMSRLEPGSMFKILTLAEALDKGVLGPDESLYCKGGVEVQTHLLKCDAHHGTRAHGMLTPEMAIAKSCNVAAANWAMKVGYKDFVSFVEGLGLLEKTKLGVPGELSGSFNYDEYAKTLQLATLGFGQSITCTPVGLTSAFCMLANEGKRMKPRLIKKIGNKEVPLEEGNQIISPGTAETVLEFMESVIESDSGTGKTLRIPGYRLGGKTGTAQKRNEQTNSMKGGGYVSNFVGFVPADKPRAVILVMIDHPQNGSYYGASVAGPVFVALAKAAIRRLGIPPSTSREAARRNDRAEFEEEGTSER